jgi:hypothetical protein
MIPIGYMYKRVSQRPDWIKTGNINDIFSVSSCISENFSDYINYWQHNGYWLFDSPAIMESLAREHFIALNGLRLFYYEVYKEEYNDSENEWKAITPEASFTTNVLAPKTKTLEGFDVTSFYAHTSPECSPLSCNSLAETVSTNQHCLFRTFDEARDAIEKGLFKNSEPGPYRIIAVYSINESHTNLTPNIN